MGTRLKIKKYPDAVHQFTFILAENGMKHKPEDCRVFTECTVFKAMALCDGLKEYSFDQYKEDYKFMDTVIMLSKDEEFDTILDAVDEDTLVVCDKLSELSQKQKIEAMPTFKFYKNK